MAYYMIKVLVKERQYMYDKDKKTQQNQEAHGPLAHLRNQFKSINTSEQSYEIYHNID